MKYQSMQCTTRIDKCMFDFYRNCCWLVRSCTVVARQEPMAVEIPVHPGPVRGPGRCQAALYPDAQNCPTPTPRSPDPGNENELLQQSFRSHHIPVQRTRYYKARVLTLHCLNVSYLHSEQANNELMSCICMMGNFLLSGCLAFLCDVAACHYRRGGGGIQTSADPNLMQQLLKLDRSSQAFCMSPAPTDQCGKTTLQVLKITFELWCRQK